MDQKEVKDHVDKVVRYYRHKKLRRKTKASFLRHGVFINAIDKISCDGARMRRGFV
jgi:hypothetical protein